MHAKFLAWSLLNLQSRGVLLCTNCITAWKRANQKLEDEKNKMVESDFGGVIDDIATIQRNSD